MVQEFMSVDKDYHTRWHCSLADIGGEWITNWPSACLMRVRKLGNVGEFYWLPLHKLFTCGGGTKASSEDCDDGNTVAGDGCDPVCRLESGYVCSLASSVDLSLPIPAGQEDMEQVLAAYTEHPVPGMTMASVDIIHSAQVLFVSCIGQLQRCRGDVAYAPAWLHENKVVQHASVIEYLTGLCEPHRDPDLCKTGFANLALTDQGYFGKGLHATTEAIYACAVYHKMVVFEAARCCHVTLSLDIIHSPTLKVLFTSCIEQPQRHRGDVAYAPTWLHKDNVVQRAGVIKYLWVSGIYTTPEAIYAYNASAADSGSVLLLCWVSFFSAYPVVAGDMAKLTGKGHWANHDAHFVPVVPEGPGDVRKQKVFFPCADVAQAVYHEMVVFEAAQMLPRYVVRLCPLAPDSDSNSAGQSDGVVIAVAESH
eukprot:m51a1_g13206 hypothetical protein (423) ;mRNA; r:476-2452